MIDDLYVTPQKIINVAGGNVYHAMKANDIGFSGFGEAYFSIVELGVVKAWKRHHKMVLNIVVPVGKIRFVIFDDRNSEKATFKEVVLSKQNYCRLTVPPMVWVGFQGIDKKPSMLLNIADIPHDPNESDQREISEIKYNWNLN